MKKKLTMIFISISIGILFTILFLNKETFYAKEEYQVYAFQVASFENLDNATKYKSSLPSSIIIKEDNSYKVIVGIYKDIDIVNKMLVYFEDNKIKIYLKNINVSKSFYTNLDNLEKILINTTDNNVYNKVNQSILDLYINGDKI